MVGWKHKPLKGNKFTQQKLPEATKDLKVIVGKKYSFHEILQMVIQLIKNENNEETFVSVHQWLGDYSGNEQFHEAFVDKGGKIVANFWDFVPRIKKSNGQLRMYLYTEAYEVPEPEIPSSSNCVAQTSKYIDTPIYPRNGKNLLLPPSELLTTKKPFQEHFKVPLARNDSPSYKGSLKKELKKPEEKVESNCSKSKAECTVCTVVNTSHVLRYRVISRPSPGKSLEIITDTKSSLRELNEHYSMMYEYESFEIKELCLSAAFIPINDITTYGEIGRGGFGEVKLGTWGASEVAVKVMSLFANDHKQLIREVYTMDRVRHPNIVALMGISYDSANFNIVMEHFDSENLRSFIFHKPAQFKLVDENQKNKIALQICTPIAYLHSLTPPIKHKDLKPENILIDENFKVKIIDFGLSRIEGNMPMGLQTTAGNNVIGTYLYMAPEILAKNKPAEMASDIWALGCVIKELFSGQLVWNVLDVPKRDHSEYVKNKFKQGTIPDLSQLPYYLKSQMSKCFDYDATKRCSAKRLAATFKYEVNKKNNEYIATQT